MSRDANSAQTVEKALEVLRLIGADSHSVGLKEIVAVTGYSTTTVQRLLKALESQGAVARDTSATRYRIGWMIRGLQPGHEWHDTLKAVALPHMLDLRKACGDQTVGLYVMVNDWEFTCIQTCGGREGLQHVEVPYQPIAMGAGATSLVFLAQRQQRYNSQRLHTWLQENSVRLALGEYALEDLLHAIQRTATDGFAYTSSTRFEGMAGISSALRSSQGTTVAALTLSGLDLRFVEAKVPRWRQALQTTCRTIERQYGASQQR